MLKMSLIVVAGYVLLTGIIYYQFSEKEKLKLELNSVVEINNQIANAWADERNATQEQIDNLTSANERVKAEVRYVEKIKYKIIKDNNSSCVGAINDIYKRLWQQSNDSTFGE